jgi:hypothetical protein
MGVFWVDLEPYRFSPPHPSPPPPPAAPPPAPRRAAPSSIFFRLLCTNVGATTPR